MVPQSHVAHTVNILIEVGDYVEAAQVINKNVSKKTDNAFRKAQMSRIILAAFSKDDHDPVRKIFTQFAIDLSNEVLEKLCESEELGLDLQNDVFDLIETNVWERNQVTRVRHVPRIREDKV